MVTGGMEFSSLYRRGRLQRRKDFQKIVRRISKDHFRLFRMKVFIFRIQIQNKRIETSLSNCWSHNPNKNELIKTSE